MSLLDRHDVRVMASGAAFRFLAEPAAPRGRDLRPELRPEGGRDSALGHGAAEPAARQARAAATRSGTGSTRSTIGSPDVVISDFEPLTRRLRSAHPDAADRGRQHQHARPLPPRPRDHRQRARGLPAGPHRGPLDGARAPSSTSSPPTSEPPVARGGTTLVPPIVRPEIVDAQPERGDHLVVYSSGDDALIEALRSAGIRCLVYGMRGGPAEAVSRRQPGASARGPTRASSRRFAPRGESSRAAGSRCSARPSTSASRCSRFPLRGQFEQMMNARYTERLGYGSVRADARRRRSSASSSSGSRRSRTPSPATSSRGTRSPSRRSRIAPSGRPPRAPGSCGRRAAPRGGRKMSRGARRGGRRGGGRRRLRDLPRPVPDLAALRRDDLPRPGGRADDRPDLRRRPEPAAHRGADVRARPPRSPRDVPADRQVGRARAGHPARAWPTPGTRSATTPGRTRRCRCGPPRRSARSCGDAARRSRLPGVRSRGRRRRPDAPPVRSPPPGNAPGDARGGLHAAAVVDHLLRLASHGNGGQAGRARVACARRRHHPPPRRLERRARCRSLGIGRRNRRAPSPLHRRGLPVRDRPRACGREATERPKGGGDDGKG